MEKKSAPSGVPSTPPGEAAEPFSPSRRAFLAGMAISLLVAGCYDATGALQAKALPEAPDDTAFLGLSRALTGHADLNPVTAARISQAFGQLFPELKARFPALAALVTAHSQPTDVLAAAAAAGLAEPALAIVAAWYKGTVGQGMGAISIAYADALMNAPVADALYPPTYQLGGPGWWTAEPPPVGIPAPAERRPAGEPAAKPKRS